jgi:hypothetical protein
MKLAASVAFVLLTSFCGLAQDAKPDADPAELVAVREKEQDGIRQAVLPVFKEYLRKLEGLNQQLNLDGQTDAATAVQNEARYVQAEIENTPVVTDAINAGKIADPPDLAASRQDEIRNLQRAALPVLQEYLHTLDSLGQNFTKQARFDALTVVQKETKDIKAEIENATDAVDLSNANPSQLIVLSATYGDLKTGRTLDLTAPLQQAIVSGSDSIVLDRLANNQDPAPTIFKQTRITYSIHGERKERVFDPGVTLKLKGDLQDEFK